MASNDEAVEKLASICGVETEVAKNLLEACGGNLEMAVDMHMEDNGGGGGGGASAGVAGEDEVRAPIPQRQEVMVEPGFEGYVMNNRVNKSHSQSFMNVSISLYQFVMNYLQRSLTNHNILFK